MGLFAKAGASLRRGVKHIVEQQKRQYAETKVYKAKLRAQIKEARRKAYLKESIRQASLSGKRTAKQKFQPSNLFGSALGQKVQKKLKKKKKQKGITVKTAQGVFTFQPNLKQKLKKKLTQQQKQQEAFNKMIMES